MKKISGGCVTFESGQSTLFLSKLFIFTSKTTFFFFFFEKKKEDKMKEEEEGTRCSWLVAHCSWSDLGLIGFVRLIHTPVSFLGKKSNILVSCTDSK